MPPTPIHTYTLLAGLPLMIDGYTLEGLSRRVSTGFRRFTTVFRLAGAGHEGLGEDVTYEVAEQRRLVRGGALLPLAGDWTLDGFSRALNELDLFPDGAPAHETSRTYRRWALESAALDLALRQAGSPLHDVLGRDPCPVRFVVSLHLGPEPSCKPLERRLTACPALRFKLDATSEWDAPLLDCLARGDRVDAVDFKGFYQGTLAATRTDPDLYHRVADALPSAWLEDPDLSHPAAAAALHAHRNRVTWDAPIHSADDIAAQPWPAQTVNIKPSRFGTLAAVLDAYDHCAAHGIGVYGGGQYELGPGRGQIQYLAALFHPDAPNDIAPPDYDQPTPMPDVPCSPMTIIPAAIGFAADVAPRIRAGR
jgi:L-alanine-DL-glutamate epimerase-like enolase superfamily enzyme